MKREKIRLMLALFTLALFLFWTNATVVAHDDVVTPAPVVEISVPVLGANVTVTFTLDEDGDIQIVDVGGLPEGSTKTIEEGEIHIHFPDGQRAEIEIEDAEFEDGELTEFEVEVEVEDADDEDDDEDIDDDEDDDDVEDEDEDEDEDEED